MHLQASLGVSLLQMLGPSDAARTAIARGLTIAQAHGDALNQVRLLGMLSMFHVRDGDFIASLNDARRSRAVEGVAENPTALALANSILGRALQFVGEHDAYRVKRWRPRRDIGHARSKLANPSWSGSSYFGGYRDGEEPVVPRLPRAIQASPGADNQGRRSATIIRHRLVWPCQGHLGSSFGSVICAKLKSMRNGRPLTLNPRTGPVHRSCERLQGRIGPLLRRCASRSAVSRRMPGAARGNALLDAQVPGFDYPMLKVS